MRREEMGLYAPEYMCTCHAAGGPPHRQDWSNGPLFIALDVAKLWVPQKKLWVPHRQDLSNESPPQY